MKSVSPFSSNSSWRLPICFILLVASGLILVQCSAFSQNIQLATETPTELESNPSATPESSPSAINTQSSTQLMLWLPFWMDLSTGSSASVAFLEELQSFEANHPGIDVVTRLKEVDGPYNALNSLIAANNVAPGALPSLVALQRQDMERAIAEGILHPLERLPADVLISDWYPFAINAAQLSETIYCLPFSSEIFTLVFRSDLVIVPPDLHGLIHSNKPMIFAIGDPNPWLLLDIYLAAGGGLIDENGQPALDEGPLTQALAQFSRGSDSGVFPAWLMEISDNLLAWTSFEQGRSSWVAAWINYQTPTFQPSWHIDPIPGFESDLPILADTWMWCLSDPQQDRGEIAEALALQLTSPEFLQEWTAAGGGFPVRPSTLAFLQPEALQAQLDPILQSATILPPATVWDIFQPSFNLALNQVMIDLTDPATAAAEAMTAINTP